MISDVTGAEVIVDDIVIWGQDHAQYDTRLKLVLDSARHYNLKAPGMKRWNATRPGKGQSC